MDRGAPVSHSPWGHTESDTPEATHHRRQTAVAFHCGLKVMFPVLFYLCAFFCEAFFIPFVHLKTGVFCLIVALQ